MRIVAPSEPYVLVEQFRILPPDNQSSMKKEYIAPAVEVLDFEAETALLAFSQGGEIISPSSFDDYEYM